MNALIRGLILVVFFVVSNTLYAEEAVQTAAEPVQPSGYEFSGNVELGGFKTTGNSETQTIEALVETEYSYNKWAVNFSFEALQTSDGGVLTSDNYEASIKGIYNMENHAYGFIQLGYREDFFSGVYNEKFQLGGFGYRFFTDEPAYELDTELGYGLRVTRKLINGIIRPRIDYDPGTHIAIFSKYHFTEKDLLKLNIEAELGNDDDYIKREIAWVHNLFESLNVNFSYVVKTNTKPEVGTVGTDDKLSVKLGYEF